MKINHFVPLLFLIIFSKTILYSQNISINEIMSSNDAFLQDMDSEYNDWIELYNNENQPINLYNFSLSDDISQLNKWTFPNVTIPANGFLLIFASGKDIQNITELHTNFKIKQSGEAIFLSYSNQIVSTIPSIQIPTDKSYGAIQNGNDYYMIFQNPTPNTTNENSRSIYTSHTSGFYGNSFLLTLVPSKNNQKIYYTLNGKIPSINDKYYISPLLIENNSARPNSISNIPTTPLEGPSRLEEYIWVEPETVYKANIIRYALFESDSLISPIYSKTFFVDSTIQNRYTFPIISLITDSLNLFDYEEGIYIPGKRFDELGFGYHPYGNYNIQGQLGERPIHITYFEPNGILGFEANAGMRIRGQGSTSYPQKNFTVYFKEDYGTKNIEYPIFKNSIINKRIIFRNSGQDFMNTHFKDALLQSILEPLNMELQDFQPAILFINGEYWGIHNLREKYDRFYFEHKYNIENDNINILDVCGGEEEGDNEDYIEVINYIYENDLNENIHYEFIKNKIDIDNYINFQIVEIFYGNSDWPCNNFKVWKTNDVNSKWRFLIYDLDLSFGTDRSSHYDSLGIKHATLLSEDWPHCECSNILFVKLLENEAFKTLFLSKFEEHLNTTFKTQNILNKINEFKKLYIPEMGEHIQRWKYPDNLSAWYEKITKLETFAINRPCFIKKDLIDFFDLEQFDFQCLDDDTFKKEYPFLIYPNPNQGLFYIRNEGADAYLIGKLRIFNANGQIIFIQNDVILTEDNSININLPNLPNGVYFITYQNVDFITTEKLVIMN